MVEGLSGKHYEWKYQQQVDWDRAFTASTIAFKYDPTSFSYGMKERTAAKMHALTIESSGHM